MDSGTLIRRLMDVRRTSEVLIEPLEAEALALLAPVALLPLALFVLGGIGLPLSLAPFPG